MGIPSGLTVAHNVFKSHVFFNYLLDASLFPDQWIA